MDSVPFVALALASVLDVALTCADWLDFRNLLSIIKETYDWDFEIGSGSSLKG